MYFSIKALDTLSSPTVAASLVACSTLQANQALEDIRQGKPVLVMDD
jgi:hypothetical protein